MKTGVTITLLILIFLAGINLYTSAGETECPRIWWKLDEGSGTIIKDSSGNGLNGTMENCEWTVVKGRKFLKFNGRSSVVSLPGACVKQQEQLKSGTLSCWYQGTRGILLKCTSWLVLSNMGGGIGTIYFSENNSTAKLYRIRSGKVDKDGWHYAAYTWKDNIVKLYLDGVPAKQQETTGDFYATVARGFSPKNNKSFGIKAGSGFTGNISNVKYYTRELSAQEISAEYKRNVKDYPAIIAKTSPLKKVTAPPEKVSKVKKPVPEKKKYPSAGLVGYWDFNEGIGNVVSDKAGWIGNMKTMGGPKWIKNASGACMLFDNQKGKDPVFLRLPSHRPFGQRMKDGSFLWNRVTISFWVNPVGEGYVPANRNLGCIFYATFIITPKKLQFNVSDRQMRKVSRLHAPKPESGKWTFVAGTWDGYVARLYINGKMVKQPGGEVLVNTIAPPQGKCPFRIGLVYPWLKECRFKGYLDELKLYSRVLSPEEIKKEYEVSKDKIAIIK